MQLKNVQLKVKVEV